MASYVSTTTLGNAQLDNAYYWSKDKYVLSTGYGAKSQADLQTFSGASANLDAVSPNAYGYGYANATEGSAVSTTVYLGANEKATWQVQGLPTKDYVGDFAYASVAYLGSSLYGSVLYSNTKKIFDDGNTSAYYGTEWSQVKSVGFTAPVAGYYKFTTGVVDAGDTVVDSQVFVNNFGYGIAVQTPGASPMINLTPAGFVSSAPVSSIDTTVKTLGNATLSSGVWCLSTSDTVATKTDSEMESFLGLAGGTLDQIEKESPYGYTTNANATSGSVLKKYVQVSGVGDTINFNYFWDGGDYVPYDDFAFVSVGGKIVSNESKNYSTLYKTGGGTDTSKVTWNGGNGSKSLVSIQGAGNYNDVKGTFAYKVKSTDNIIETISGLKYVELGIGITDEGDTVVDSSIQISDIGSNYGGSWSGINSSYYSSFTSYASSYTSTSLYSQASSSKSQSLSSSLSQFTYNQSSYSEQTLKQNTNALASSLGNLDFGLISQSSISSTFDWNATFNALFNTSTLSTSLSVDVSVAVSVKSKVLSDISWSGVNFGNIASSTYKQIDFNEVNFSSVNFSSTNYASFDYGAVNWSSLTKSKYSEINWSSVNFSSEKFSTEAFSSINWSKFSMSDYTELKSNSTALSQFKALENKSVGFSSASEFTAFKSASQQVGSNLSFKSFSEINFSSSKFSSAQLNGVIDYSSVSTTNFSKFTSTAYSALDWSNSQFVSALGATASSTSYKSINYSKVDWSELTNSASASSAFNYSAVNYKQFSSTNYSAVNWANFDFAEAKSSSTYSALNFSKVQWNEVSTSQYSSINWNSTKIAQATKSSSFSYEAFISSSSFSSSLADSASTYKSINFSKVDFSSFSSSSYNALNWNNVNWSQAQASNSKALTSIDYNKVQWSEISTSNYKKINWSKVQYNEMSASSYSSVNWSSVNYKQFFAGSASNYSASSFSSVEYTELNEKSYNSFVGAASSKSVSKFSSFNFQQVSSTAISFTSTAAKADVFNCGKLSKAGVAANIDLLNDNTSSSVAGDVVLLNKTQKSAVNIKNFTLGVDQLSFAGLGALASSVAFNQVGNGLAVVAGGTTFAVLEGLNKSTVEGSDAFKNFKGKGLGLV